MKYFSLNCVKNGYELVSANTKDKFWGILGILYSIDSLARPGANFSINTEKLSTFLEQTFRLKDKKIYNAPNSEYSVVFANDWEQKTADNFIVNTPDVMSIIIWAYRSFAFDHELNSHELFEKFVKDFHLSKDSAEKFFNIKFDETVVEYSDNEYNDIDLFNKLGGNQTPDATTIKMNKSFVVANAGDLSRGPFFQPLYASLNTLECLIIFPFDAKEYYHVFTTSEQKLVDNTKSKCNQIIYYGCPGSGKSHEVRKKTNTAHNEGFAGLSSIERQQAYQKYLDDKNGHKKNYKGGKVNIIALTHPKLMSYIASCTEYEINSIFEISNEEDFNAIIEALKGCEAYQNDSITKGSGCHWETGLKSYGEFLKDQILNAEPRKDAVFRTTFHPDTDYASFVGCYKPSMNDGVIEYSFTPQVFTNAYIAAWENTKKPVYLVIEEINRGNCAQIFGDLFQLLDRDKETGKSEYPIKADKDLVAHIEKVLGAGHEGIKNGELCLPPNLIIYATMNTSDQSLFPMDSAFKRRWDWEYVPINYSKDIDSGKFVIEIDDATKYSWVEFLESVNDKIYDATNSEDKQMGNFFIKKSIKANEFVNKVMFYLWNEVCKEEYGTQRNFFRKGKDGKTEFKFTELFGDNQATILKEFMTSLGIEPIGKKPEEPAAE